MKKLVIVIFVLSFSFISNLSAYAETQIEILAPWQEKNNNAIKFIIVNNANLSDEKISIIKKVIESEKKFELENQVFFQGWTGALQYIKSTNMQKFDITVSEKMVTGDIVLELLKQKNPSYDGWSTPYYIENRIALANIQIYDADNLPIIHLENLVRHEIGHALGLGHASSQNVLMYELVNPYPTLISNCVLEGLKSLNNGYSFTKVECVV